MEIIKIGKLHTFDKDGNIQNSCILPIQQNEYKLVVNKIVAELLVYIKTSIHSIYIRGSVAKGIAIPFVSDIDIIVILNNPYSEKEILEKKIDEIIREEYEYVNGIELFFITQNDLLNSKIQFLLKTQCGCIYGKNVIDEIRNFKIEKEAFAHSENFHKDIQDTLAELKHEEDEFEIKSICSWIMKRIIRTAFETVMIKDNNYTRDLYVNYEIFCNYHPNIKNEIKKVLELAINPTNVKEEIIKAINGTANYIQNEINKSNN